jgi:hypothetical protein
MGEKTMPRITPLLRRQERAGHWWLMSVILATQVAEIRRIIV